jgi:hypothetical protein
MAKKYNGISGLQELMVVDFYGDYEVPEHDLWRNRKLGSQVIPAEACARNIWVGFKKDFEDMPQPLPHDEYAVYQGEQAYAHTLSFMLGFLNPNGYDAPSAERFYKGWYKINNRNPKKARQFSDIVSALTVDYELIRKTISSAIRPERSWLIARDLSGHQKGDSVLIIGDIDDNGRATKLTQSMAITMNGKSICKASSIDCTHPDSEKAECLFEDLDRLFKMKNISMNIATCDFMRDLPLMMEMADHVYITLEMGKYPKADQFIRECWKARRRNDNTMVHLRDCQENTALSGAWNKLDHFTSPQDVRDESSVRERRYKLLMWSARSAAQACAHMRISGKLPDPASVVNEHVMELCAS